MHCSRTRLLSAFLLALAPFACAQSRAAEAQTTATYTGKFVFEFTITIESGIPTSVPIYCIGNAFTRDEGINILQDVASVTASRSGSTATCTVTVPYSWPLTTPSSDQASLGYEIIAGTSSAIRPVGDSSFNWFAKIPLPANGATTTEKITVAM